MLKSAELTELVSAIRETLAGRHYLSPPLSDRAIQAYVERTGGVPQDAYQTLTAREREILQLAAEGLSSAQIGELLSLSRRTVETHRAHLMQKLSLSHQTALVRYAISRGLLSSEHSS